MYSLQHLAHLMFEAGLPVSNGGAIALPSLPTAQLTLARIVPEVRR